MSLVWLFSTVGGGCRSHTLGTSLFLCNDVNQASQMYRLGVWQYVVFMLKLILLYLTAYLTDSLPCFPSNAFFALMEELRCERVGLVCCQLGLASGV